MSEREKILQELSQLTDDELLIIRKLLQQSKQEKTEVKSYLKVRKALSSVKLSNDITENREERF